MADRGDYRRSWSGGGERSFRGGHGEGEHEPWRRDRYGSLYDQDRTNYGSGWDRERGGYGRGEDSDRRPREDYPRSWRPAGGAPYGDLELDTRGREYEAYGAPADYAYHPHAEFEPDYLHWRDEQLRLHDRDYEDWRRRQQRQYDEDYRRFRTHRREGFSGTFREWRASQTAPGAATPTASSQARAATDGWDTRSAPEDHQRRRRGR